jgi:2-polyprenyl-6-methoxyphenol hydroxylase-like FAD-dependent oxidoreductase
MEGTGQRHEGRRAEIAGAGLAGLFAGAALAQRGWSVRIHERSAELRMFGAGIWLWENGLTALEAIRALDGAIHRGQRMSAWEIVDHRRQVIRRREARPNDRLIVPPRADLYDALIEAATDAGAEIVTSSEAASADPAGVLHLTDGSTARADLVVAADGVRSRIREHLGLTSDHRKLGNGAIRVLIPRRPDEHTHMSSENWNGSRVLLYNPCSPEYVYLCFVCPTDDARGRQVPLDAETWIESFPHLEDAISRVEAYGRWDDFETVRATRWSAERVAIIGDASHAQPPWLGQAANLAFSNALALAEFVTYAPNIPAGLAAWERACRPITDHTESWTNAYGRIVGIWPPALQSVRSMALKTFTRLPGVERMLNRAQRTPVIGTERLPRRSAGDTTPAAA